MRMSIGSLVLMLVLSGCGEPECLPDEIRVGSVCREGRNADRDGGADELGKGPSAEHGEDAAASPPLDAATVVQADACTTADCADAAVDCTTQPEACEEALAPTVFGELLRSWYDAADYDASTGSWNSKTGLSAAPLAQPTFSKRPRKTTANARFGGLPTVDADGRDDELSASAALLALQPNTLGILSRWPGGPANYLVGQYATTSYQFYRWDGPTEQMYADPNFKGGGYASAEIGGVHLWVFSKSGLSCSVYRDGELLGTRDMASFSGSPTIFSLFSGNGAGFTAAEVAELFTIDRAINQVEARGLTEYFRNKGYPL